jgi:hypothetical protein
MSDNNPDPDDRISPRMLAIVKGMTIGLAIGGLIGHFFLDTDTRTVLSFGSIIGSSVAYGVYEYNKHKKQDYKKLYNKDRGKKMFCIKCGQEFDEGAKFCSKCGFALGNTAPGKKFLKITGVLFIVFGVFGIISFLISSTISIGTNRMASELTNFFAVLSVLLCLFLGITGVMYCNDIKKAKLLKYFVLAYIGFYVISSINTITTVNSLNTIDNVPGALELANLIMIIGVIIGSVIPILYFIGAQKNLKAQEGQ